MPTVPVLVSCPAEHVTRACQENQLEQPTGSVNIPGTLPSSEHTLVTKQQAEQRSTQRLTCVMRRPSAVASRSPICRQHRKKSNLVVVMQ